MKKIGIIVAMEKEFFSVAKLLETKKLLNLEDKALTFCVGKMCGATVILCKGGVGKVNAAMAACTMIDRFSPDAIISTGVAGGLSDKLKSADVVVGSECAYHDVDCGSDVEKGRVQGLPKTFPSDSGLQNIIRCLSDGVHFGTVVSGDSFISDEAKMEEIRAAYPDALAVDMEACAVAQVCYQFKCPFVAIKVISDSCDETEYALSMEALCGKSFRLLHALMEKIGKLFQSEKPQSIASFKVNHLKLKRGVYVSRKDGSPLDDSFTTFDIRMREPYKDEPLKQGVVHTIEHIGATYLRNCNGIMDEVVYWGPMGCLTGFYLILRGDHEPADVIPLLKELFVRVIESDSIPGCTKEECGNCELHDLEGAKKEAASFYRLLSNIQEENIHYPE